MSKDLLYREGYIAGYMDGVKDAVLGKVNDWRASDTASLPIKAMDISTRAYNCLAMCGCVLVKDVADLSSEAILRMRNLGPKTASEIANWLTSQGILSSAWSEYI